MALSSASRAMLIAPLLAAVVVGACGTSGGPSASSTAAPTARPTATATTMPAVSPAAPATSTASADPASGTALPSASPASPTPVPTPKASPTSTAAPSTQAPSPGANLPNPGGFWGIVEQGLRQSKTLVVDIRGPNDGTLRFEPAASATVIEGVVGYVCLGGRSYDGQSGFAAVPGRWTCGADALVEGFRHIGQPIDAWNTTIPSDQKRRESVTVAGDTWTWRYRATSPFYGGAVETVVTLDRSSGRITAATRTDPTGTTRYGFRYGARFPKIAVPRG